jgi:hypothetical protein
MSTFQSSAGWQGRQFAQQCSFLLEANGFRLTGRSVLADLGVEIDEVAENRQGSIIWFEYKGSFQGARPGLLRTDTVKKAVCNGALLRSLDDHPPYVVLTSHVPTTGAAAAMLEVALTLGYLDDVICVNDPVALQRLAKLAERTLA